MTMEEFENTETVFDKIMKEYADAPYRDLTLIFRACVILMCRSPQLTELHGTDAPAFQLYNSLKREINTDIFMELGPRKHYYPDRFANAVLDGSDHAKQNLKGID